MSAQGPGGPAPAEDVEGARERLAARACLLCGGVCLDLGQAHAVAGVLYRGRQLTLLAGAAGVSDVGTVEPLATCAACVRRLFLTVADQLLAGVRRARG